jgi:hypothetical protein
MARSDAATRLRRGVLFAAAALSLAMLWRASPGGDQLNLLARGWLLAHHGELVPWGNPLSGGGHFPGVSTSLAVGLPLLAWSDHRSPIVLVWLLHLAAWLLLDRATRGALSPLERAALATLWALGPMRIEASTVLWNPSFLPAIGAAHLGLAVRLRERGGFLATFGLVALLGVGAQLHPSMLLLGVATLLLAWRRYIRFSWAGVAAGVALTVATVAPAAFEPPPPPPATVGNEGFPFRGLALVFPLLKGLVYWVRAAALAPSRRSLRLDFTETLGERWDDLLLPGLLIAVAAVAGLTTIWAAWANARLARPAWTRLRSRWSGGEAREWLVGYVACGFAAAVVVYAAAPTTPQAWQGLSLLHAACLPAALAVTPLAARFGERRALRGVGAFALAALLIDATIAFGSPNYRCAGRESNPFPLRSHSAMFEALGMQARCAWPLDRPGGWWPDVLPEADGSPD